MTSREVRLEQFFDLTRTISQKMQVYPGDPQPKFEPHSTIKDDKVNVTRITVGSHTGTHVDAQSHFLSNDNSIESEPLSKFIGKATIIDVSDKGGGGGGRRGGITAKDLNRYSDMVQRDDILLTYTGTGDRRTNFAYLDISAARWIVNHKIKCIGIDTLSIEKYGSKDAPTHKLLLSEGIGIIENLDNLKQFVAKRMFLVCLPLPFEGIDGSLARAILFEMIK
jgi:arylformamidase